MVVWRFEIGELLAAALRYRHLRFRLFCIKIILKGIQKSEITDCDTWGCGMWDIKLKPFINKGFADFYHKKVQGFG
jgi:hypothetical protein